MGHTRCQDRACPLKSNCMRYDAKPLEDKNSSYFVATPRVRDTCIYYAPFDHTENPLKPKVKPLQDTQWPTDNNVRVVDERQ